MLVAAAGLASQPDESLRQQYEQARALLRVQHYRDARAEAETAILQAQSGSEWFFRLRLLRVEILIEQRDFKEAEGALDFQLPSGARWNAEWARYRVCQANLEYRKRHFKETLARLAEARTLAVAKHESGLIGAIELLRAKVVLQQKQPAAAYAGVLRVLAEAEHLKDPYIQMKAKGNLGFILLTSYRYEEAIPWFRQALAMSRNLKAADDEARSLMNLGWCYYRLGDLDRAQRYQQEAEAGFARTGNQLDSNNSLGNIASTFYSRQQYAEAAQLYKQALDIATKLDDRESRANWLINLAKVATKTGDWDAAEKYNSEASGLDKELRFYAAANAGYIAAGKKNYARAEQLFRSVIEECKDPLPVLDAHAGLAHVLAGQGKNRAAEAEYKATDAALEHSRVTLESDENKLNYFSSLIGFYQDYVDYMMALGRSGEALEIAESSHARTLVDRLSLAHIHRGPGTAASFREFAGRCGCVLLSYWLAPNRSYLWVITASRVVALTLPSEKDVSALVEVYDALIQHDRDPLASAHPAGRKLYNILIAPAKAMLPKNVRVILAPDGPLYTLNFETLPVFDGTPHYWIEDARIAITPSLSLLSPAAGARVPARKSLLLIGNPISPVPQYPALEFAGQEMDRIEKSMAGFRQLIKEGRQAAPAAYRQADPRQFAYIHFVAHAVANSDEPLDSAVILSPGGTEYKLRARDVINIPIDASLVTLSGCRSAGARIYAGEGLVGLAWAFMEAGAKNVIAGLWDVDDRSTAELASHLYAGLAHNADPADALRAAKLELLHTRGVSRKPYYWAPFELFTRQVR